jgi:hypothetical protein
MAPAGVTVSMMLPEEHRLYLPAADRFRTSFILAHHQTEH